MKFSFNEELSGIRIIEFFLLDETTNWPINVSDKSSGQIDFFRSDFPTEATVQHNSFVNRSRQKDDFFEIDLQYTILTRSEELEKSLEQYINRHGVAIVDFYNGSKKLFGTNTEPLMLSYHIEDGGSIESTAGTQITILGVQRNRPVFIKK